jgi:ABC-type transport system involved in multi-copper enzyme maturation permease subunit
MFWIIALLIVTMSVASVAFEQRDRIIWQTMTKPVAAWQYLLGKWLGVMGLGAVLLSVCGSGVFLFTEYLKDQKAIGEIAPYVPENGAPGTMTEDRYILFNQVLAASVSRRVSIRDFDPAVVDQGVGEMMDRAKENSPEIRDDEETRARMREQLLTELRDSYLAIEPGTDEMYYFTGLEEAKENARWLTLRYRVNVGSNDPRSLHWLTFWFPNYLPEYFQVPPGQTMSLNISPGAIQEEGILPFRVVNGRVLSDRVVTPAGAQTMSFPPDGLELRYSVGSYRMNFLRVMLILWFKLGFLAMLGIAAATCLSFPVASMVSFGTFLLAESSRFLLSSLESYQVEDNKGNILYFNKVIELVTTPLAKSFSFYSNLRPTANLVDGTLVAWGQVATGAIYMGVFTLLLYAAGVVIFRNRELATYSGH